MEVFIKFLKLLLISVRVLILGLLSLLIRPFKRKKKELEKKLEKILIIGLSRIGDNVASIPAIKNLKENFPDSKIFIFLNNYLEGFWEVVGYIDRVIYYRDENFIKKIKLIREYSPYDLVIDFTCDYTFNGAFLAYFSNSKYKIGYNILFRGFLFDIPLKVRKKKQHVVEQILRLIEPLKIKIKGRIPKIEITNKIEKLKEKIFSELELIERNLKIGIHPGGYYPSQRWDIEKFVELCNKLFEKYDTQIILIFGKREEEFIEKMAKFLKKNPVIFYNKSIPELIGLISGLDILICNNSGPLHIASGLGIPTVSLMGPTDPIKWAPLGEKNIVIRKDLPCSPCKKGYCKKHTCMKLITVEEVFEKVRKVINGK